MDMTARARRNLSPSSNEMKGSTLESLPNELITNILATLHYRDLVSCTQVRLYLTLTTSLPTLTTGVQAHSRSYP